MGSIDALVVAAVTFVGCHFLLSHPLRAGVVRAIGERGFQGLYSLIAILTFGWMVMAFRRAPVSAPLWAVGDTLWAVATVLMLLASILLMGSLIRNPALPTGGRPAALPETARGVFAITRHPMMWAFALWGFCHLAVLPTTRNLLLAGAIIVLALAGAALQDRKKRQLQPELWPAWEAKTSYLPFAAIAAGRARLGGFGMHALAGGVVVWLVATWAHMPLAGWAAGIWRWL
ncbi:NnrU family protein [Paraburkholderia sp. MMS20-SJTR3]|uniref:NnrU family protein n=1 Tax=Paraburkholderia sejongensis TaxID=2886946 RepID=A0ABS8K269_9BURK|nr:NnrU family protein [Paraburkholderia sp. MMS20-SJTR3]MCC8395994.1 NnrU family protein [Paraburkholderia sp. MMS20-SJTR3]